MSSFGDMWDQADQDDWEPPKGTYTVEIIDADAFTSQAGKAIAKVRLRVTKGAYIGKEWAHIMGFSSDVAMRISRAHLAIYGIDKDTIGQAPKEQRFEALKALMPNLLGVVAEVTVKHSNGYVNTEPFRTLTGESDIPGQETMFEAAAASTARNAINDDEELPY